MAGMKYLFAALTLFLALSIGGPAFADSCRINLDVTDEDCGCIVRDPVYQDRPFNQVHLCKAVLERMAAKDAPETAASIHKPDIRVTGVDDKEVGFIVFKDVHNEVAWGTFSIPRGKLTHFE